MHILRLDIESGLKHGALAGDGDNLVVAIIERWADAPRIAHREHLARARQSAHHIAAVIVLHRRAQHVGHLHMLINIIGDIGALESLCSGLLIETLHLAVQAMSHQLQRDVRVTIDTRTLSLLCQELEDLVDIRHVEVAAQTQVLGTPVVAAQERVYKRQSTLACGRVAQVAHQ